MDRRRPASASSHRARARFWIHARVRGLLAAALGFGLAGGLPAAEVVNVATCEADLPPGSPAPRVQIRSNPARTPIAGGACAGELSLALSPSEAARPGEMILHVARAEIVGSPLVRAPELHLALAEGLVLPADTASATVTGLGGDPLPHTGEVDVTGRRLIFRLPDLPRGSGAIVRVELRLSPEIPAQGVVTSSAELHAEGCASAATATAGAQVVPYGLELRLSADRATAVPGDAVGYVLELSADASILPMAASTILDTLPEGFRYLPGSARRDGGPAPEPSIAGDGRTLRFAMGPLAPGTQQRLSYGAVVGPGAREGEGWNRARASAHVAGHDPQVPSAISPEASAVVVVRPGPFRREAVLAGRVFVDDDGDGIPGADEPGLPGVLVLLEDGRGTVTDVTGRWHLEGVPSGLHVVRADPDTLPVEAVPGPTRFVTTRASTLEIVDVPVGPAHLARCSIGAGRHRLLLPAGSLMTAEGEALPEGLPRVQAAADWLADLGLFAALAELTCADSPSGSPGVTALRTALRARLAARMQEALPATLSQETAEPLEELLRRAAPVAAIVSPASGSRAGGARVNVEVVYPMGTVPDLRVAGRTVPRARIGTHSVLPARGIEAARFVGVELAPGRNRIELRAGPPGAPPAEVPADTIELVLPGEPVELRLSIPEGRLVAGGGRTGLLRIEALDAFGVRAPWAGAVTLRTEGASPLEPDREPAEDGLQLRLQDGAAEVRLEVPALPGQFHAWARSDRLEAELLAPVVPEIGAWRLFGLAEGNVAGDAGAEGHGGEPPGIDRGISDGGARVALFGRGAVGERSQLTVSVDTARRRDPHRLFDGREPEAVFPVHGDASVQGEDTAHQGPVYLRLDAPLGFAQWGDAATGLDRAELARYDRRLSGLTGEARRGPWAARAFAAPTDARAVRDVFQPDGTSGPYLLSRTPLVLRSERVVLETRDRFRTDEVLARRTLVPGLDYDLDADSGALLLARAVAPFDADLQPQRLVVLYEARSGGADPVAAGVRLDLLARPDLEVGSTAVVEGRDGEDLSLLGLDVRYRPRPGILFRAEAAQSDDGSGATEALAAAVTSRGERLAWEVSFRDLPSGFANPTFLGSPELGSRRSAARASWQPGDAWRLRGEAFRQESEAGLARSAAKLDAERRFGALTALAGIAAVASEGAGIPRTAATVASAGLRARPARRWTAELFRQQAMGEADVPGYPDRTSLGIGYDLDEKTRVTLRQEWESSGALPSADRTVVGVESRLTEHTRALARYTLEEAEAGASLRASAGIETVWPLSPATRVTASVSRMDTRRGDPRADHTALAAGWERRAGRSLASSRYELRLGEEERRHLGTLSAAYRLREPLTLFASERLFATEGTGPRGGGSARRFEGRLGAAWRPRAGAWHALARLDHAFGGGTPITSGGTPPGGVPVEPGATAPPPGSDTPGIGTDAPRLLPAVTRDSVAISLAAGFRPTAGHRLAGTVVFRHVAKDLALGVPGIGTSLVSLHYTADVGRRTTLGGSLRRFRQGATRSVAHGAGVEVGWLALRDLWIVGGYNVAGFSDGGFADAGRTDRGPFAGIRVKFDEGTVTFK